MVYDNCWRGYLWADGLVIGVDNYISKDGRILMDVEIILLLFMLLYNHVVYDMLLLYGGINFLCVSHVWRLNDVWN